MPLFNPLGPPAWIPADNNLLAATSDPALMSSATTSTMIAGTLYLAKLTIRQSMTISNLWWGLGSNGVGTSTTSFTALYSSSGALLTGSSDIGATFTSGAGSAVECALTTPQPLASGTFVWAALMMNLSGSQPALYSGNNIRLMNVGLTAANYRWAVNGTTLSALPSPITPASNSQGAGIIAYWAGAS